MEYTIVSLNGLNKSGGVERVAYYISCALKEKNLKYDILTREILEKNYPILKKINNKKIKEYFSLVLTSFYLFRNKRKNFIISNGFFNPFYRSNVLFAHGSSSGYKKVLKNTYFSVDGMFEFFSGIFAKKIIAVSEQTKKEWSNIYKINSRKIEVLNNCVDTEIFNLKKRNYEEKSNYRILFCGRLEERKGLSKLLELARKLENQKKYKLLIATFESEQKQLFSNFKNTEIRTNLDFSELQEFYSEGDIFYFPSVYEGFEMVTLEALACGVPVLGNDVGGIKELSAGNFIGVHLINNNENIIKQIDKIVNKYKSQEIKNKIFIEVSKNYSLEKYKEKLKMIFNDKV